MFVMSTGKWLRRSFFVFAAVTVLLLLFFFPAQRGEKETVTIAIVQDSTIMDIDQNYFKCWLEEQTELSLSFVFIPEDYAPEYLEALFASGEVQFDAMFLSPQMQNLEENNALLQRLGKQGYILSLNEYITPESKLSRLFDTYEVYDLERAITAGDGALYYVPGFDVTMDKSVLQSLWLNRSWLNALDMQIPENTQELYEVLRAFRDGDPNGNGKQDEIVLTGSTSPIGGQSYQLLMNAFVYCDPVNTWMTVEQGAVSFAPMTEQWRSGVQFLHTLYAEGLLDETQFSFSAEQLFALANDPRNLLGGFTCNSITDVLLQSSAEMLANYIHVPPIAGPQGVQYTTVKTPMPCVGGVITARCENPQAVFGLLDLMLSEEAFLIGRYGEEHVDWEYALPTDIDYYGRSAVIKIKNQLSDVVQNKHLNEIGPFYTYPLYADRIIWSGMESDQQYINARVCAACSAYKPQEYIEIILFENEDASTLSASRQAIHAYTEAGLEQFITGEKNPYDETEWQKYLQGYVYLDIDALVAAVQQMYNASRT